MVPPGNSLKTQEAEHEIPLPVLFLRFLFYKAVNFFKKLSVYFYMNS